MDPQLLVELREFLKLVSHEPGRLRLKVDLAVRKHPAAAGLGKASGDVPGIRGIRFNIFTQTLGLDYDPQRIAPELFDAVFTAEDGEALALAAQALRGALGHSA